MRACVRACMRDRCTLRVPLGQSLTFILELTAQHDINPPKPTHTEAIGSLKAIRGPPPPAAAEEAPAPATQEPAQAMTGATLLTVSVPAPAAAAAAAGVAAAEAPSTASGQVSAAWDGMMEEGGQPSADPFALDQPLLAFEALMDGIVDDDAGMMLPGMVGAGDEEAEQASAGSAGVGSSGSSSSSTPGGLGGKVREERKKGDDVTATAAAAAAAAAAVLQHKSAAGQATAACSAAAAAPAGAKEQLVVLWECAACTMENQGLPSDDVACCVFCAAPHPQQQLPKPSAPAAQEEAGAAAPAAPGETPQEQEGQTQEQAQGGPPQEPAPKKRKINAADLAMQTLALASEIQKGRAEVGLVRDAEYGDIHDVFMERLHPDPDFGEDEDLCLT